MSAFQPLVGVMPDWYDDAVCAQADPEDFYPEAGSRAGADRAKMVCAECPVRDLCLAWAIDTREQWGIWGGLSERERRGLWPSSRRDRPKCPNGHAYTPENTRVNSRGQRQCITCARATQKRHRVGAA